MKKLVPEYGFENLIQSIDYLIKDAGYRAPEDNGTWVKGQKIFERYLDPKHNYHKWLDWRKEFFDIWTGKDND